jgi:hypothetical protein
MQNPHGFMRVLMVGSMKNGPEVPFGAERMAGQAIDTAMKASKNISTAPAMGNTMGMAETTSSTGSDGVWLLWGLGLDMGIPLVFKFASCKFYPRRPDAV